jgi:hypothetical protein
MFFRLFSSATMLTAILLAPATNAQEALAGSIEKVDAFSVERKVSYARSPVSEFIPKSGILAGTKKLPVHFNKKQFIFLSAAVYAASLADMHQTLRVRHYDWWTETDPLARPIVKLPAPAYYVTGLALATGINWLSWKMGHSKRWHKVAVVPQLLSVAGNLYGYKSNCYSSY